MNSSDASEFTRIKELSLNGSFYFGVGLIGGFQLWTNDGSRLLYHIPCKNKNPERIYCFYAISEFKLNEKSTSYDSIVCADNYGNLHLITGSNQSWKSRVIYTNSNVTAIDIKSDVNLNIICCSYENGEIYLFKLAQSNDSVDIIAKFRHNLNLPAISLGILSSPKHLLLAGYANGEVKAYSLCANYELVFTIGSHVRMINALCVLDKSNVFATAGDDCFVNIFKIGNDMSITLLNNIDIQNKIPVGIALIKDKEHEVDCVVTSYDNPHLIYIENCLTI